MVVQAFHISQQTRYSTGAGVEILNQLDYEEVQDGDVIHVLTTAFPSPGKPKAAKEEIDATAQAALALTQLAAAPSTSDTLVWPSLVGARRSSATASVQ